MTRSELSSEEIESFRSRATNAAMMLFAEKGYAAMTMRSLATVLGCSPMTPYRYFANKEALLMAVRGEAFARFADSQQAAATASDPIARLLALKRAYIDFALAQPDAYRVMFELAQASELEDPVLERESKRAFSFLADATRDAVGAGALQGDSRTLAHLFWANTHGLVMLHLAGKLTMGRSIHDLAEIALEFQGVHATTRSPS